MKFLWLRSLISLSIEVAGVPELSNPGDLKRGRFTAANRDHGDGGMDLPRIEPDHRMAARLGKPGDRQGSGIAHATGRCRDKLANRAGHGEWGFGLSGLEIRRNLRHSFQQHGAHDQHQQDQKKAFPTCLGYNTPI